MAVDLDIVKKGGAWFSYNDMKLGQGRDNAKEQANLIVAEAQKKAESILRERIGRMSAVCAQLNDMFDKDE